MASERAIAIRRSKVAANLDRQLRALCLMNGVALPEEFNEPIIAGRDERLRNIITLERVNRLLAKITGEPEDSEEGAILGGPGPQAKQIKESVVNRRDLRKLSKAELLRLAEERGVTSKLKKDATTAEIIRAINPEE